MSLRKRGKTGVEKRLAEGWLQGDAGRDKPLPLQWTTIALAGGSQVARCFNRLLATNKVYPMYQRLSRRAKEIDVTRIFATGKPGQPQGIALVFYFAVALALYG